MMRVPLEALAGHGQSIEATIDKERCLGAALSMSMKIANAKFGGRGFSYWHFDANAGSGHNDLVDVPGSPIVFHITADACVTGMRRCAFFCDLNVAALKELYDRRLTTEWKTNSYLIPGDNEESLDVFAEVIRQSGEKPQYVIGSVLIDPNGWFYRNGAGRGAPVDSLIRFARTFPRIDIVLNLNARTYRLQRGSGHKVLPPRAVLASLAKAFWLVRCTHHGANDWLLAVGRNMETGDHKKLGFWKLESAEGEAIINKVEGGRQSELNL
jgi:hypothetical protein